MDNQTTTPTQMERILSAPPIRSATDDTIKQMVALTYFRKGQATEPQVLEMVSEDFKRLLSDEFYYLTTEEVNFALKEGVLGKYGKVYKVDIATMYEWVSEYTASADRLMYIQKRNLENAVKALPMPKPLSDEEVWHTTTRPSILKLFAEYRDTKRLGSSLGIGGWLSYDILNKRGILNPTQEEKNAIWRQELAKQRELQKLNPQPKSGIRSMTQILVDRETAAWNTAANKSKEYFVKKFFDGIIESGGEITDYV